jgi:hypothetical protein
MIEAAAYNAETLFLLLIPEAFPFITHVVDLMFPFSDQAYFQACASE